jgi:hypothetical protein
MSASVVYVHLVLTAHLPECRCQLYALQERIVLKDLSSHLLALLELTTLTQVSMTLVNAQIVMRDTTVL